MELFAYKKLLNLCSLSLIFKSKFYPYLLQFSENIDFWLISSNLYFDPYFDSIKATDQIITELL